MISGLIDERVERLTTIRRKTVSPISAFQWEEHRIKESMSSFLPAAPEQSKPILLDQRVKTLLTRQGVT